MVEGIRDESKAIEQSTGEMAEMRQRITELKRADRPECTGCVHMHTETQKEITGKVEDGPILREDVSDRVRVMQCSRVLSRIREEIWSMQKSRDLEKILVTVRDGLKHMGVPFNDCGVNLVDKKADSPSVQFHGMTEEGQWLQGGTDRGADIVSRFWQGQAIVYRRDLDKEDLYGEAANIEQVFEHRVRSVIDVPFSQGTLAVNSLEPEAFSHRDIEILQEFARVLSEGFSRKLDLQILECRNRELEREIAERKQAEKALEESEKRFRRLSEAAFEGIAVTEKGKIVDANDRLAEILGYEPSELIGMNVMDAVAPESRDVVMNKLSSENEESFEHMALTKNGSILSVEVRSKVLPYEDRTLRVTIIRDITERKRAEREREALQQLSHQLTMSLDLKEIAQILAHQSRQLFNHDAFMLMLYDKEEKRLYDIYGEDTPSGENQPCEVPYERLIVAVESQKFLLNESRLINRLEEPVESDLLRFGDTTRLSRSLLFAPVRWEDQPIGLMTVHNYIPGRYCERDLELLQAFADHCGGALARIRIEKARQEAEHQLDEERLWTLRTDRLRSLGQMAAGVAHELNQPLAGLSATAEDIYIRLVEDMPLTPDDLKEMTQDQLSLVARMTDTIEHLRLFSRDTSETPPVLFSINEVITASLKLIGAQLKHHGIALHLELEEGLPPVSGNPHQLEQVVLNLLTNGRDTLEEKEKQLDGRGAPCEKRICIRSSGEEDEASWVVIEVADNGVGMDASVQEQLFEPFFTTKEADRGTGLGLSISYAIVQDHRGQLTCESHPGEGTTFRVRLPGEKKAG